MLSVEGRKSADAQFRMPVFLLFSHFKMVTSEQGFEADFERSYS